MVNAIQRASFVVLNGSRLSRAFLTRRAFFMMLVLSLSRSREGTSLRTLVSLFSVAARFRSSFSRVLHLPRPSSAGLDFSAGQPWRNTSTALRKSRLTSRTLDLRGSRLAVECSFEIHCRQHRYARPRRHTR